MEKDKEREDQMDRWMIIGSGQEIEKEEKDQAAKNDQK